MMKTDKIKKMMSIFLLMMFCSGFFSIFQQSVSATPTATDMANAVLADPSTLVSASYTDSDSPLLRQVNISTGLGIYIPIDGTTFLFLSTGIAGGSARAGAGYGYQTERGNWYNNYSINPPADNATLSLTLHVPSYRNYVEVDYSFMSAEYPELTNNDNFTITCVSPSMGTIIAYVDVDTAFFGFVSDDLTSTGYDIFARNTSSPHAPVDPLGVDWVSTIPGTWNGTTCADAGATILHTASFPCTQGEDIVLTFHIVDVGDNQFDSQAYIDNIRFTGYATPPPGSFYVETDIATAITNNSAVIHGISREDGFPVSSAGFLYKKGIAGATTNVTASAMRIDAMDVFEHWNASAGDNSDDSYTEIYGANWCQQMFQNLTYDTYIKSVRLKLYRIGNPGILNVTIKSNLGGGILCYGTINANTFTTSTSGLYYSVNFTDPYPQLSVSTVYRICLRATSGSAGNEVVWRYDTGDVLGYNPHYHHGTTYYYLERSTNSGSTWSNLKTGVFNLCYTTAMFEIVGGEWQNPLLFSKSITGLNKSSVYYYKAWGIDDYLEGSWEMFTTTGDTPIVTAYNPLNFSSLPLNISSQLSVTASDAENDTFSITYHLTWFTSLVAGTWVWIGNYTVSGCHNGTYSIPLSSFGMTEVCRYQYGWWVTLTDVDGTSRYPLNGTGYDITVDFKEAGVPDWLYVIDETNVSIGNPSIILNYPSSGPKTDWRANHTMSVTVNSLAFPVSLVLHISMPCGSTQFYIDDVMMNGTYIYDLFPYVPFNNYWYNISFFSMFTGCGYTFVIYTNSSNSKNFTIGAPGSIDRRFAATRCVPGNGDTHAYQYLLTGVRFLHSSDTFTPALSLWFFLQDVTTGQLSRNYATWDYLSYGTNYTGSFWWINLMPSQTLRARHHYILYVGILKQPYSPYVDFSSDITSWSNMYDDSMVYVQNFSIHSIIGADLSHALANLGGFSVDYFIAEDAVGPAQFEGMKAEFWTYPVDENPVGTSTGWQNQNWAKNNNIDSQGIPGLSIIIGCIIVALFSIAPFMLGKKKGVKNVPMPVQMTFTLFGFFLAFGMGLFPLWIFIPPTIFILVLIFYKALGWVKKTRGEMEYHEMPPEGG